LEQQVKIRVDSMLCDGNGACALEAPEIFELDDADELVVLDENPAPADRVRVEAAAAACPKRAISIVT
jgi:ferredoxin